MISPVLVSSVLNIFLLSATLLSIGLGIFVWWQNKKSPLHITFGLLALSIAFWLFGTFMMLKNCHFEKLVIFWDRFLYLGVVFLPIFLYHFVLELTKRIKEEKNKILLLAGYIIAFLFLLISRTDYFVNNVYSYKWGCHTIAQTGHHLFLVFFSFYIFLGFYLLFNNWRIARDPILRARAKYLFASFCMLLIGAIEYLPAYKIGVFPFGYFFPLIWLIILTYVITRYQLLVIKVIATDILIGIVVFIVLVFTIFSENTLQLIGRGTFLILISIFSWLAMKGIHREVQEKEILEEKVKERTKELQKSKEKVETAYQEIKERKEDLEKFYKLTVGRELKMIELKQKIKELEEKIKGERK